MKKSILSVAVLVTLAVFAHPAVSQEQRADELGPVAAWVLSVGNERTLDDAVTMRLGLGDAGVPVRQKGYRTTADDMRHSMSVAPNGNHIVVTQLDADNNGYIWRTTRAGVLLMTLKKEGGAMKVVPNSQAASKFAEEKQYFLSKIPMMAKK